MWVRSNTDRIVASRTEFRRSKCVYYIRLSQRDFSDEHRTVSSIGITVRPEIRHSERLHQLQEKEAHLLAADDVYTPAPNLRAFSIQAVVFRESYSRCPSVSKACPERKRQNRAERAFAIITDLCAASRTKGAFTQSSMVSEYLIAYFSPVGKIVVRATPTRRQPIRSRTYIDHRAKRGSRLKRLWIFS